MWFLFPLFSSAMGMAFRWMLRAIIVKWLLATTILVMVGTFLPFIIKMMVGPFMPSSQSLTSVILGLPDFVVYGLVLFKFDIGMPMLITGVITRFVIRRVPFFG